MTTEPFRNAHLSYSRLSRFEQCPLSYRLHYIEKRQAEPGLPLRFGKLVHAVLERLIKEVLDDERTGPLSEERALEVYREAWTAEGLTGVDVFEEGLKILRDFVREQGVVDHRDVLAIEKEFRLPVGPFTVLGFIDRVDWVDDETVESVSESRAEPQADGWCRQRGWGVSDAGGGLVGDRQGPGSASRRRRTAIP